MRMELPLADPPIKGLQYIANPLAIILNNKNGWDWFYSDYVQLIWYKEEKLLSFYNKYINEIPTCIPGLEFQCLEKQFVIRNMNIIQFMINAINEGWYVFSSYNEQYIPNTYGYLKKEYWYHDFMMHGYDLNKQEFIFTVYTRRGKYERNIVSFENFLKGFLDSQSSEFEFNRINLFRLKDKFEFYFDKEELVNQIEDYIGAKCGDSKYTVPYWQEKKIYGIDIYKYIISIFENVECSINDKRMLHMLWEHKKCMQMRVDYMICHDIIRRDDILVAMFETMTKRAEQLKMLQLKMCIKNDISMCVQIVTKLKELKELDVKSMHYLLNILKSYDMKIHLEKGI